MSVSERLNRLQERLHQQSLFSKKDFQTPLEIIKRVNDLRRLRYLDQQGLFISEINKIFDPFLESENLDPEKIDYNGLIALLFALRDSFPYPDQPKYALSDDIKQYEASLLIDTLLGKNNDFIKPGTRKKSTIIPPAYLLIRALKENDSSWLDTVSFSQENVEQLNFFREVIVKSIRFPDKRKKLEEYLEKRLDYASAWPLPKYTPLLITSLPKTVVLPVTEKSNSEKSKKEEALIEEKKDGLETLTQQEKEVYLLSKIFAKFFEYDIENSEIILKDKRRKEQKLFGDIHQKLTKLIPSFSFLPLEKIPYFTILYALSPFSLEKIPPERLLFIIDLFQESLKYFQNPQKLSELKGAIDFNNPANFSSLDKVLLEIIYSSTKPDDERPTEKESVNLLFALRKIFLLRLFGEYFKISKKFNLDFHLDFSYQLKKIGKYQRKFKENKLPFTPEFLNMREIDILRYLASFFIAASLKNNLRKKDFFYTKKNQEGSVEIYLYPFKEVFGKDLNESDILDPNSRFIFASKGNFYVVGGGMVLPIKIDLIKIAEGLFEIIFFLKTDEGDLDLGYFYLKEHQNSQLLEF